MSGSDLKQRLAAILAADAAGYSRLMAASERATVASLDAARSVFKSQIESNQGRVIDMAGDSVLAVFETATGAVSAAIAVQQKLNVSSTAVPEERRMRFRIGVHMGEVIEKTDGTVYGDGVNIAARLEALAEPGGIAVSAAVQGAVRGKLTASFIDLGEQRLKNIAEPVNVFRIRVAGARAVPGKSSPRKKALIITFVAGALGISTGVYHAWQQSREDRIRSRPTPLLADQMRAAAKAAGETTEVASAATTLESERTRAAAPSSSSATEKAAAEAAKAKDTAAAPARGDELFRQASALEQEGKGREAVKMYTQAARAGNGKAAKRLAEIYNEGLAGIPRDYAESLKWYNAARALGETTVLQQAR